jgi:aryl-alcohol dehydrogenase-like predicted oxidoreductase
MVTRKLGKSDIEVSSMGLGCWAIGGQWWWVGDGGKSPSGWGQVDDAESIRAIHVAIDLGINFFDTADAYGCGHSERVLGKALKGRRDKVIIATKFGKQFDEKKKHYFGHETSPELIRNACESSLRRLDMDYIDLYQFHWGDYDGNTVEVRETLEELVKEGKIRYYGWSTDIPENARSFAEGEHCVAVQNFLSVMYDSPDMLAVCDEFGLASINKGPLAMGILTGKFDKHTTFPEDDIRNEWNFKEGRHAERLKQVELLQDVLTSDGRTLVQGALAWIWERSELTIPIPGFKTVEQIEENAKAMEFGPLNAKQMEEIDEILERQDDRE